jgi:hypothetical protein
MSTEPTPTPTPTHEPPEREIVIYHHSQLFYWWPVWAVGFVLFLLTYFDGTRLAVIPSGANAFDHARVIPLKGEELPDREVLVMPKDKPLPRTEPDNPASSPVSPKNYLHMSKRSSYGVVFAAVLLTVIMITNVPLRGLWSVVIIAVVLIVVLFFALFDWWDKILAWLSFLDIRINAGGYMFISLLLFTMWAFTTFLFDRQIYAIFTPGQLKVCTEIGSGEKVYDVRGLHLEKQRSDLFRHWILGLGSGDLVIKTSGAHATQFEMPNVLFIGRKLARIERMLKWQATVDISG